MILETPLVINFIHRKARALKLGKVNSAHDTGEIVNGFVKCRTKGGMIVDVLESKHSNQLTD